MSSFTLNRRQIVQIRCGDRVRYAIRWSDSKAAPFLAGFGIGGVLSVALYAWPFPEVSSWHPGIVHSMQYLSLLLGVFVAWVCYLIGAMGLNFTVIDCNPQRLRIREFPLPLNKGVTISREEIRDIVIRNRRKVGGGRVFRLAIVTDDLVTEIRELASLESALLLKCALAGPLRRGENG